MNPWTVARRYAELRETIGTAPAMSYTGLRSEVCADCGGGPRTSIVVSRRERSVTDGRGRTRTYPLTTRREVCAECLSRSILELVRKLGEKAGTALAAQQAKEWRGVEKELSRGAIKLYGRASAAEDSLLGRLDRWIYVRDLMETVPPRTWPKRWRRGAEAMILYQREDLGTLPSVCDAARVEWPSLAPWTEREIARAIATVYSRLAWRLATRTWKAKEGGMARGDWLTVAEAAVRLGVSPDTIRRRFELRDASMPGAKVPRYLVAREEVEAWLERLSAAEAANTEDTADPAA